MDRIGGLSPEFGSFIYFVIPLISSNYFKRWC